MAVFGQILTGGALAVTALSVIVLLIGQALGKKSGARAQKFSKLGYLLSLAVTVLLSISIVLILYCFFAQNYSLDYVAHYRSEAGWIYVLSGLWGGRQGSLLFWAWLITVFNTIVIARKLNKTEPLSNMALMVSQLVLTAFLGVLVFSTSNNPFIAIKPEYLDASGNLIGAATGWGMNALLEHWAMVIHPPTTFVGYAGFTIPFAYAVAALITNDSSQRWVDLCMRTTVVAWFFLGAGIGLGALWAYVVLGWGGYWAWDPVENASFLPWLVGVALIHTFTIYRQRALFKRWGVMCACIAYSFVVLGTFITRSGIIESVHAFETDPVSISLFLILILASLAVGLVGLAVRWKSFGTDGEIDSLVTREAAYYFNNAIMLIAAFLLAYLTISSALPDFLPFGGSKLSAGTYNAIARPLGILYCLILAVCPLLGWGKTASKDFLKKLRLPAIIALIILALLVFIFINDLLPIYNAMVAAGGTNAEALTSAGAPIYYYAITLFGFLVGAVIICNTLFMIGRDGRARAAKTQENIVVALFMNIRSAPARLGGYLSHLGIGIILIGLIGSSMYVSTTNVSIEEQAGARFTAERYTFEYLGYETVETPGGDTAFMLQLNVYTAGDRYIGTVTPGAQVVEKTQQQKLLAGTLGLPTRDIFVVFQGIDTDGHMSIEVKINPLISCVWVGFGFLLLGPLISSFARRRKKLE